MSVFNREKRDSESDQLWDREREIGTQRERENETVRVTDYEIETLTEILWERY